MSQMVSQCLSVKSLTKHTDNFACMIKKPDILLGHGKKNLCFCTRIVSVSVQGPSGNAHGSCFNFSHYYLVFLLLPRLALSKLLQ